LENVAGTQLTVTESPAATSREWKWTATSGSGYASFSTAETGTTYTPLFATAGTYYVVCQSTLAGQTVTSNEVQINVTSATANSVVLNPSTTQNLMENVAGTTVTATETPSAATSQEWKWTTTSGSAYQSFTPANTTLSYTPQFATAGTYYVICEADFAGDIVSSAELIVIVSVNTTGIEENPTSSISIYGTASQLTVDMSASSMKNASIQITGMDGKVVASQSLNSNTVNKIQLNASTGIYFYTISNGSQVMNGKVFIK